MGANSFILDLRDNTGGYLDQAAPKNWTFSSVTTPPAKAGGFFWKAGFNSGFLRNA
jgi:hypothetical protein